MFKPVTVYFAIYLASDPVSSIQFLCCCHGH